MKAASSNDIADCPFCGIEPSRIIRKLALTIAFWDGFPVSAGHALVVPRRHVNSWVDTTLEEKHELVAAIDVVRALVDERHNPDGYNVGINDGAAAGQTVMHLHVHVIRHDELATRCVEAGLPYDVERTRAVAWWAYDQGERAGAHAWIRGDELERLGRDWRNTLDRGRLPHVAEPEPPTYQD